MRKLVDAWNVDHPNKIEVTVIPAADYMTKVGASVAAGAPPDLMAVDLIYVPQFAAANQLTDITEMAKALPYFDKLSPSHVRLATYEDKIYGLPFNAEGSYLIYNKDLFTKAGLDPEKPPTTWAEIADAAKKITALGDDNYGFYFSGACAGCNAFTFLPLMWANGGDVLSADGKTATLTDPAVKAALEFYKPDVGRWRRSRPAPRPTPARTSPMPSRPAKSACTAPAPSHQQPQGQLSRTSTLASPSCLARTAASLPLRVATASPFRPAPSIPRKPLSSSSGSLPTTCS